MRFLADECCDFAVVRALRLAGHDVLTMAEVAPRAVDNVVIALADREGRILLTEDKDFGQLVYANARHSGGVILVRFPSQARKALAGTVVHLVSQIGEHLLGSFVVVQPGRTRIGRSPPG